MSAPCDVIVLGLGTGGEDLALRLARSGLQVVGIEADLLGGECPYWACIPTKIMVRAANLLAEARRIDGMAGSATVTADWGQVARRVADEAAGGWDDAFAVARFQDAGGRFVRGRGRLVGPATVEVGDETFTASRGIVIATGSQVAIPPIPGIADVDAWTTHDAIQATELPASMLVLGGGAVGCELGQVFSRFGVEVTIIEGGERLLPAEEPESSEVIEAVFRSSGVSLLTGRLMREIRSDNGGCRATLDDGATVWAQKILVAAGRRVALGDLGLETAGLDGSARTIDVDHRMRAAPGIWALGDVTDEGMFTSKALYQGSVVFADITGSAAPPADYAALPRVTFTDPEVGSVGLTEAAARASLDDVAVVVKAVPATFRGWLHGAGNDGVIKLVIDRSADRLVGATSVGPSGGEILGTMALAIHAKVPMSRLADMIYAYPTFYGGIGEAVGAYARGIGKVLDPDASPYFHD
ncbi:MAG TPA: NAD(P)/FAD-dependent oxidoreductase [Acidimicrobiia bacterium]|jgi:pyruvate/2-oxoglutarate dehydrogenase complex dihydrolipoamide dehydrogenase (E3) component|nr:NAD(P)/FAD-dependent oxidoreductase [Acidimicrobiia bacterium]